MNLPVLVTKTGPLPHAFPHETVMVPAGKSPSGFEQHERTCTRCSAVMITVISQEGSAWREWRSPGARVQTTQAMVCAGEGTPA
jgi:hypothetical protein